MNEASTDAAEIATERLAAVCEHLEEIREDLLAGPSRSTALVDDVLAAVRARDEVDARLSALHAVLQAGDPHGLDGYSEHGSGNRSPLTSGVSRYRPSEQIHVCPLDRCARIWWPRAGASAPSCAVDGATLRREEL